MSLARKHADEQLALLTGVHGGVDSGSKLGKPLHLGLVERTAGAHEVILAGNLVKTRHILGHDRQGEVTLLDLARGGLDVIGRVGERAHDVVLLRVLAICLHVCLVNGFDAATARIAREVLEGVRAQAIRLHRHGEIALALR